jgi:bacterial/archaeal transporter family protein
VLVVGERPSATGWLGIAMIGGGAALIASGT